MRYGSGLPLRLPARTGRAARPRWRNACAARETTPARQAVSCTRARDRARCKTCVQLLRGGGKANEQGDEEGAAPPPCPCPPSFHEAPALRNNLTAPHLSPQKPCLSTRAQGPAAALHLSPRRPPPPPHPTAPTPLPILQPRLPPRCIGSRSDTTSELFTRALLQQTTVKAQDGDEQFGPSDGAAGAEARAGVEGGFRSAAFEVVLNAAAEQKPGAPSAHAETVAAAAAARARLSAEQLDRPWEVPGVVAGLIALLDNVHSPLVVRRLTPPPTPRDCLPPWEWLIRIQTHRAHQRPAHSVAPRPSHLTPAPAMCLRCVAPPPPLWANAL